MNDRVTCEAVMAAFVDTDQLGNQQLFDEVAKQLGIRFCRSKGLRLKSACVARLFKRPVSRTGWQRTRLCLVGSTALF